MVERNFSVGAGHDAGHGGFRAARMANFSAGRDRGRAMRFRHFGRYSLKRKLLHSWEVVLFAPDFAVVLGGHLEQLQMTICGGKPALIAQALHLGGVKGLKVNRDPQVLIEHLQAVDATNRGGNRQAHGRKQKSAFFNYFARILSEVHRACDICRNCAHLRTGRFCVRRLQDG